MRVQPKGYIFPTIIIKLYTTPSNRPLKVFVVPSSEWGGGERQWRGGNKSRCRMAPTGEGH